MFIIQMWVGKLLHSSFSHSLIEVIKLCLDKMSYFRAIHYNAMYRARDNYNYAFLFLKADFKGQLWPLNSCFVLLPVFSVFHRFAYIIGSLMHWFQLGYVKKLSDRLGIEVCSGTKCGYCSFPRFQAPPYKPAACKLCIIKINFSET